MAMQTEEERAADEYRSTLNELNDNSKIQINALTMLAEDNRDFAVHIAACIENQLKVVPNRRKLPVLYLIDSICKNYPKSSYVQLFTQNIVSNFCNVFEVSDEKTRKSLHKLRMTWESTKLFPQNKLNAIDERVHEMDQNWPILYRLAQQKQINQQKQQKQAQQSQVQSHSQQNRTNNVPQTITNNNGPESTGNVRTNNGQQNGRRKRARLAQAPSNRQINRVNQQPIIEAPVLVPASQAFLDPNIVQVTTPQDITQVHPTAFMDPSITIANDQLHHVPTAPFMDPNIMMTSQEPQLQIHLPCPTPQQPPSQQSQPQLICTAPFNATQGQPNAPDLAQQLATSQLQPALVSVLDSLYGGQQCSNCSLRFDDNDNNRYKIHLDWHFRQNSKSDNMFARRKWYYPLDLWVQFREINDDDLEDDNNIENTDDLSSAPISDCEVPTAPASKDDERNICSVCHETFEKFWAEDEEEWRLRNARLHKDERVYHPLCLMDMLQTTVA